MRIKNKEIRKRRHRKEQVVKAARRDLAKQFVDKPKPAPAPAPEKAARAKKPAAGAETKKAVKKTAEKPAAPFGMTS